MRVMRIINYTACVADGGTTLSQHLVLARPKSDVATSSQCWLNVGLTSQMVDQHEINIGLRSRNILLNEDVNIKTTGFHRLKPYQRNKIFPPRSLVKIQ